MSFERRIEERRAAEAAAKKSEKNRIEVAKSIEREKKEEVKNGVLQRANELLRSTPEYRQLVAESQRPELHEALSYIWKNLIKRKKEIEIVSSEPGGFLNLGTHKVKRKKVVDEAYDLNQVVTLPQVTELELLTRTGLKPYPIKWCEKLTYTSNTRSMSTYDEIVDREEIGEYLAPDWIPLPEDLISQLSERDIKLSVDEAIKTGVILSIFSELSYSSGLLDADGFDISHFFAAINIDSQTKKLQYHVVSFPTPRYCSVRSITPMHLKSTTKNNLFLNGEFCGNNANSDFSKFNPHCEGHRLQSSRFNSLPQFIDFIVECIGKNINILTGESFNGYSKPDYNYEERQKKDRLLWMY